MMNEDGGYEGYFENWLWNFLLNRAVLRIEILSKSRDSIQLLSCYRWDLPT
jgi:hypothetical protein